MKRSALGEQSGAVASRLQQILIGLLDGAAQVKQLHWTVKGPSFGPVHAKLDEIEALLRDSADGVAERMTALGVAPDGRTATVSKGTPLKAVPGDFVLDSKVVSLTSDLLLALSGQLRSAIQDLGEPDPVSQDLVIGITADVEKQLWMMQAQEG
jgi:starvation-inducible DNA-binding protein